MFGVLLLAAAAASSPQAQMQAVCDNELRLYAARPIPENVFSREGLDQMLREADDLRSYVLSKRRGAAYRLRLSEEQTAELSRMCDAQIVALLQGERAQLERVRFIVERN